ncbi:hypothetical protein FGO68_gene14836 [Halteria grandinella]|uniref:Uncharacterized protein n=1 Tax=Halteria grandinella TaxID=5974 RepID=A0A8J8P676_HALGN|nr:hypothetical protein FGO68_gene14836 [Halteria grandinella]
MMKLGQAFQQLCKKLNFKSVLALKSLDKSTFFIFKRDSKIRQICSHIALSEQAISVLIAQNLDISVFSTQLVSS